MENVGYEISKVAPRVFTLGTLTAFPLNFDTPLLGSPPPPEPCSATVQAHMAEIQNRSLIRPPGCHIILICPITLALQPRDQRWDTYGHKLLLYHLEGWDGHQHDLQHEEQILQSSCWSWSVGCLHQNMDGAKIRTRAVMGDGGGQNFARFGSTHPLQGKPSPCHFKPALYGLRPWLDGLNSSDP